MTPPRSTLPFLKQLSNLSWESKFVASFPGDPERGNFTRQVQNVAYSEVTPTPVSHPQLIGWSEDLARTLGILKPGLGDPLDSEASLEILAGNRVLQGMRPYSARYGGHQFGQWAGQLGDGRAITLGEVLAPDSERYEFQLKGAGPTPYSRRADGRAVLRSSMREFLCSEAMHFLGVPTTRALSLVTTGDSVVRDLFYDGNPKPEPGAIVCRVSPSFLRFGNFEVLASAGEDALLKSLARYLFQFFQSVNLNGAHLENASDAFGKLLDEISRRTAVLMAHWMRVGFVHGVMNTDNMSALGLTIDYGPYGWLEPFDPDWTPNTTDAQGRRYRFGNQPAVAQWNLVRLYEAFFSLIPDEQRLHQSLGIYQETFQKSYDQMMSEKLGLSSIEKGEKGDDQKLVDELFELLRSAETDYTLFFRGLSSFDPGEQTKSQAQSQAQSLMQLITPSFYSPDSVGSDLRQRWGAWSKTYSQRVLRDGVPNQERSERMKAVNPKYVLRNYLAQNAIVAAEKGDLSVMDRLMRVLKTPYEDLPAEEDLASKRPEWARNAPGCSALSCSS